MTRDDSLHHGVYNRVRFEDDVHLNFSRFLYCDAANLGALGGTLCIFKYFNCCQLICFSNSFTSGEKCNVNDNVALFISMVNYLALWGKVVLVNLFI